MINKKVESLTKANEAGRGQAPSQEDIIETISLLDDFGIHVDVPEFESRAQMYNWRRKVIQNKLGVI